MKLLGRLTTSLLMNRKHPIYSKTLFKFCSKYVDFCYGDNNFDRMTNGEYRLLKEIIPKTKVVFDVGANTGNYSSEIRTNNQETIIHCFEPDMRAFSILKKQRGVIANNIALADKPGTKMLYLSDKSEHNSFLHTKENSSGIQNIAITTLDDYCQENSIHHIDFIKIDVEGYEFFVLKGALRMFREGAIDFVQFEFSGTTAQAGIFLKSFIDFFVGYSYSLYRIKPLSIEKIDYYPDQERFTLTNYLAIKNGLSINHLTITKSFYH